MSKETKALTINPQLAAFQEELLKSYDKANLSAKKGQTLFVGSSLMEIFPIEKWEEAGEVTFSHYIYNRAVRATTISFLLEHIESQIFNLEPSKIFINIGTNDIGFEIPEEEFLNNYDQILSQIESKLPQTQVYVMRYYPINTVDFGQDSDEKTLFETRSNKKFQKASDKIKKLADNHHFHFIDVNDGLSDENGNLKKELTFDGAHLNPADYQLVLENLKVYLEE
ncbi:GDSL-type esterase/lipase family protein [Lactococcus lactis subsp. lactis]|uniref:SGNH/GDSL hydrolase family protein n=1 Tax=Lactococcus lactis TaxID=1358 RepID=UPI0004E0E96A|nr:SGNH/GDSL hydrolase family protein [Lactococcus lactis]MCT3098389.1 lysophospholipase [Lactococcus lactis]MCT3136331.1 lysophospholipase [Lactococcus lactis]OJH47707.1 lysophospholipase [Lactococcus lactis subsp. lactis bv. diacetylactis]TRW75303.1 lysophospholipase [Lactococcus lactis]